tara:strand:- start:8106 stop:9308 length:1203 start_codon:yes stop_codon:yes gene_type:complete
VVVRYLVLLTEVERIFYNLAMRTFVKLSLLSYLVFGLTSAQASYTFEDLQALEGQKSYREFLQHARDIRPSERSKVWSEMLGNMATNYMVHLRAKKDFDLATYQYVQVLSDWPELRADAFFHTKREAYLLDYLKNCYERKQTNCREQANEAWHLGRKNPDNGTLLAQVLATHDPRADITNFILPSLKTDISQFYCRKDFIQSWVLNQIAPRVLASEDSSKIKTEITQTIHESCFIAMKPLFIRGLSANSNDLRNISYRVLKAFDSIDQSDEDLYLTTYLLEGPSVGKTFNLAWAVVKELGQNYKRRQTLLKRLAKLDPLPDTLFDSGNILKRDTLAKFIAQHLPEYFSFYADTCVRYRNGIGEYPNGNPTIQCDKFFTLASQNNWLSQEVTTKYSATLKP